MVIVGHVGMSTNLKTIDSSDKTCYFLKGRKPCTNKAMWYYTEDYGDDPFVEGIFHIQFCDECFKQNKLDNVHFGLPWDGWEKL